MSGLLSALMMEIRYYNKRATAEAEALMSSSGDEDDFSSNDETKKEK